MESLTYNVLEQLHSERGGETTYSSLTYSCDKPANIFPMNLTQLKIRMKVLCSALQHTNICTTLGHHGSTQNGQTIVLKNYYLHPS